MVIATVKGDIHDIGKNIVVTLLEARGFTVVDLGVDVGTEEVADAVVAERPDVLGLSCLLTTGFEALRETIALVRERSCRTGSRACRSSSAAQPSTSAPRTTQAPTAGVRTPPTASPSSRPCWADPQTHGPTGRC